MKKALAVCSFEILRLLKKPQSYVVMFLLPIIFTVIFGRLMGGDAETSKPEFIIVDEDRSELSAALVKEIGKSSSYVTSDGDYEEASVSLEKKKVEGVVRIEEGFEKSVINKEEPVVYLQHTPEFMDVNIISPVINDAVAMVQIQAVGSALWSEYSGEEWTSMYATISESGSSEGTIEKLAVTKNNESKTIENLPARAAGFSIMFVMIVLMSVTGTMLEAKQTGVWYRLLSTPVSKLQLLLGYLLSFFLIGWIQFGILMVFSSLLFGVVWGNILGNIVLVSVLLICVVGLGLFIAGVSNTVEQQNAIGTIVIVSTCMIGGVYWPLEIVPKFMQKMAEFVPQTWAMRGFEELIAKGGGVSDILLPIGVLLVFSALFLSVGLTRIRYE